MKTFNKITAISIFAMLPIFVNAQSNTRHSGWYISKDVQRISNDAYLNRFDEGEMTIKSFEYPHWIISKGVQKPGNPVITLQAGNVVSKGYPIWTISKAVNGKR
jgi:hypothetical protein